ncbi:MAG TPA: sulfurtransferase TusA family protein [archaeon]|nr:sulfurtransferase TusA family protein [archaeon]
MGTPCPMNFVLIKTALDRMTAGELLKVYLDKAPVGPDVAESLTSCGYELSSIEEKAEVTIILVRKRVQTKFTGPQSRTRRKGCKGCGSKRRTRV